MEVRDELDEAREIAAEVVSSYEVAQEALERIAAENAAFRAVLRRIRHEVWHDALADAVDEVLEEYPVEPICPDCDYEGGYACENHGPTFARAIPNLVAQGIDTYLLCRQDEGLTHEQAKDVAVSEAQETAYDAHASQLTPDPPKNAEEVIPAYLGWKNPEPDKLSLRLYATDDDNGDRWDKRWPCGRVVEQAITERFPNEGDRYLVVRLGSRFTSDEVQKRVVAAVLDALTEGSGWSE